MYRVCEPEEDRFDLREAWAKGMALHKWICREVTEAEWVWSWFPPVTYVALPVPAATQTVAELLGWAPHHRAAPAEQLTLWDLQ